MSSEELIRMKVENQKISNVKISINLLGKGFGSLFPFTIRGSLQSIPNAKQKELQTAYAFTSAVFTFTLAMCRGSTLLCRSHLVICSSMNWLQNNIFHLLSWNPKVFIILSILYSIFRCKSRFCRCVFCKIVTWDSGLKIPMISYIFSPMNLIG